MRRASVPVDAAPMPPGKATTRLTAADRLFACGVGAAALVAYCLTMYPDLAGGDSGELIAAAAAGGIVHPPGYPLYTMLGRLFSHLPFGSVAWRFNLLSGVCDAAAAVFLFLAVQRWSRSRWAGLIAATTFAFSPGVWQYAICAEVFALNNLFVTLLLWLALLYRDTKETRVAYAGALAFGLGLSNHHTILFTGAPFVLWVFWMGRRDFLQGRTFLRLVGSFAAGLLPYLYLPIAGTNQPLVSWGTTQTWEGFWTHVLRREYGTFRLSVVGLGNSKATEMVGAWFEHLLQQVGWGGLAVALVGMVYAARMDRRNPEGIGLVALVPPMLAVLVFAGLGNLPVADPLHRDIVARFWQQPEVFWCAWLGLGVFFISTVVPWSTFLPAAAVIIALLQFSLHFREMDRHNNTLVKNYGEQILRVVPQHALLVTKGDLITSSIRYLQFAERLRPDVRVVDQELIAFPWAVPRLKQLHPEVSFPGARYAPGTSDGFGLRDLFDANIQSAPVVVCGGLREGDPTVAMSYALLPLGLCETVQPRSEPTVLDDWIVQSESALPQIDFTGKARPKGSWEDVVWGDYWVSRQMRAVLLMNQAGHDESKRPLLRRAAKIMEGVVHDDPEAPPEMYKTLAILDGRIGLDTREQKARAAEAWRGYLRNPVEGDPQLDAIRLELENLTHELAQPAATGSDAPP